jgi:hypothetical protein
VTALADAVLPLIRTLADLHRWSASDEHGGRMHEGVDALESALPTADPADALGAISRRGARRCRHRDPRRIRGHGQHDDDFPVPGVQIPVAGVGAGD